MADRDLLKEENSILQYYMRQIQLVCGDDSTAKFRRHWRVMASAIEYFKRFYLHNSLANHSPPATMLACILLAGKAEDCQIRPHELLSLPVKCSEEMLFQQEIAVLEAVDFNIQVQHPHSVCNTLISDYIKTITSSIMNSGVEMAVMGEQWARVAQVYLRVLDTTYASVTHNVCHVAVTALLATAPDELPVSCTDYLLQRFGSEVTGELVSEAACIAEIHYKDAANPPSHHIIKQYMARFKDKRKRETTSA